MAKRTTIVSVALIAVLLVLVCFCLIFTLSNNNADVAHAEYVPMGNPISTEQDFLVALAQGGRKYLTRDIGMQNNYSFTLTNDLILDLNGFGITPGNYNYIMIYTNGHDLTLQSSHPGNGGVNAQIYLTIGMQMEKSTLTMNDGVFVSSVNIVRENGRYTLDSLFEKIKLRNGVIEFLSYREDTYCNNYYSTTQDLEGFKDKVEFGTGSLYVDKKKVANAEDFWSKVDFDTEAPPGITGKFVACLPNPDPFDTTLTLTMKQAPTTEEKGIVEIKTPYADPEAERTHFGSETTTNWYRSINGGGYQECTGYNGNFANYGNVFEDKNIELGANSYTYYTTAVNGLNFGNIIVTTSKYTIYSAPFAPSSAGVSGPENVVTGKSVTLTGHYSTNPNNVGGNIVKQEYKWQKYNTATEQWEDISGQTNLTYSPSTASAGTTQYRFCVRTVGKGNQASSWKMSETFELAVGEYDSPVVSVGGTEVTKVVGDNAVLTASVSNASYFTEGIEYQWYYVWAYAEGTPLYKAIENGTKNDYTFSNATTASLTIARSTTNTNPLIVRCKVTGNVSGYKRSSNTDDVSVSFINLPKPEIKTQPQGASLPMTNTTRVISVSATTMQGTLAYQWQTSTDNANWSDIANANEYRYFVDQNVATNGTYYRCVVSNAAGSINSESAKIVITDKTVLNATVTSGLAVTFVEGNANYELDNVNRTLVCHLGDTFLIGFEVSEGNSTLSNKTIGTDWRNETGLFENGMGKNYLNTDMAGTFEYYGRFYAEYDDGLGHVQSVLFDRNTDESLRFMVTVLPNEDSIEIDPESPITPDYSTLLNNYVSTTAQTNFRGNHKAANYYYFVLGYRLYVGIPNEDGEVVYYCFDKAEFYNDATDEYNNAYELEMDRSAAKLTELGLEEVPDGYYDAYVVMDYQSIVNENVDNQFIVKRGSYEGHHFTLPVLSECAHTHTTTTYTFDYDNPAEPEIFIWTKCDECGTDLPGAFIRIYEDTGAAGLAIISQAATCNEVGMKEHKHFTLGGYDIYYVKDKDNHWVECADPTTLVIPAGHNYQAVAKVDPTCTVDGCDAHYECSLCHKKFILDGTTYYEVTAEQLAIASYHKNLKVFSEYPASCSEYGVRAYYYCSHCNKYFSDENGTTEITDLTAWKAGAGKIEKTPHNWGPWTVIKAATETEDGIEERVCANDNTHKEQRAITASGYSYQTETDGTKVFQEELTPGTAKDLTALFTASKTANGKVSIEVGTTTLTFDKNAVNAIGGGNAILTVTVATTGLDVEGAQFVVEITFNGNAFTNGSVSVKVPFNAAVPAGKVAKVFYINGENKEPLNTKIEGGYAIFDVNHFSKFAMLFVDEQPDQPAVQPAKKGLSGGAIAGIVIAIIVALGAAGFCVYWFVFRKKKGDAPKVEEKKEDESQEEVKEEPQEEKVEEEQPEETPEVEEEKKDEE